MFMMSRKRKRTIAIVIALTLALGLTLSAVFGYFSGTGNTYNYSSLPTTNSSSGSK